MRHLLLHPTHRKFIRLIRNRMKEGFPIVFTQSDLDAFNTLWNKEPMSMIDRHQGIYRIVLTAVYRPLDQIDKDEKVCLVRDNFINYMEKCFFEAERKHLGVTLLDGYVLPSMLRIVKNAPKGVVVIMARIMRAFFGGKGNETKKVD